MLVELAQIPVQFRATLALATKIRPKRNPFLERKPLTIRPDLTFATDLTFCHLCFPHPSIRLISLKSLRPALPPSQLKQQDLQQQAPPSKETPLCKPLEPICPRTSSSFVWILSVLNPARNFFPCASHVVSAPGSHFGGRTPGSNSKLRDCISVVGLQC